MDNLRQLTQEITNHLNSCNVGLYDRPRATAILAASVVGRDLVLPSARVDNARSYYRTSVKTAVYDKLNELNEALPLDIDTAEDLIFRVWYTRYLLVHEPTHPLGQKLLSLAICCGISEVDNKTVEFLKACPALLDGTHFIVAAE